MSLIRLSGVPPYDGEYEFDNDRSFTTRELRWIKQIAGYLPTSLREGFEGGDADLVIAVVVIAMHRAGKIDRDHVLEVADRLSDEPVDDESFLQIIGDEEEEEEEELPPAQPLELDSSLRSSSVASPNGFGQDSPNISAIPDATPSPIGDLSSDTSPASDRETSAI